MISSCVNSFRLEQDLHRHSICRSWDPAPRLYGCRHRQRCHTSPVFYTLFEIKNNQSFLEAAQDFQPPRTVHQVRLTSVGVGRRVIYQYRLIVSEVVAMFTVKRGRRLTKCSRCAPRLRSFLLFTHLTELWLRPVIGYVSLAMPYSYQASPLGRRFDVARR